MCAEEDLVWTQWTTKAGVNHMFEKISLSGEGSDARGIDWVILLLSRCKSDGIPYSLFVLHAYARDPLCSQRPIV